MNHSTIIVGPKVAVDTGFIVHNDLTYPNLVALFEHLGVERAPSDMSFAFTDGVAATGPGAGDETEYSGSLRGLLGHGGWHRRSNLRLTRDIVEFGRVASAASADGTDHTTLAELATRFSPEFRDRYLYPMAAAIWSSPDIDVAAMPARSLIAFFHQHGLFRLRNRPRWSTLAGGSASYVDALVGSLAGEVRHGVAVSDVTRVGDAVVVSAADGQSWSADRVVLATHADTSVTMPPRPSRTSLAGFASAPIGHICIRTRPGCPADAATGRHGTCRGHRRRRSR